MTFAEAARELAGRSALLLGWRPDEFWNATPAELAAIFAALAPTGKLNRDTISALLERHPDQGLADG